MAMFGLFKKKEKPVEKKADSAQSEEFRAFAARFEPEEMTILAVTGPTGCVGGKVGDDQLHTLGIGLTAWMEEFSEDIQQGEFQLVTKAGDDLRPYIAQRLPRDFIVKCKVRPNADNTVFLLADLPEPAFDPDLKAILERQKAPVTRTFEGVGEFTLNRGMKMFQLEAQWADGSMVLCFDEKADADSCAGTARAILADVSRWDSQSRERAADSLLDAANGFIDEDEGESITREEFISRLVPDTLELSDDGTFRIWFNDDGMLCGSAVEIACSLSYGVTGVDAEV